MSHFLQLLGTDTPNSYGGCCYYGPIENTALETTSVSKTTTHDNSNIKDHCDATGPAAAATEAAWQDVLARLDAGPCPLSSSHNNDDDDRARASPNGTASNGATRTDGYLLFNCPEGTQRFSSEANLRLTKIKGFFFTRWGQSVDNGDGGGAPLDALGSSEGKRWETPTEPTTTDSPPSFSSSQDGEASEGSATAVMGLPGLLFTINDAGVRHANFFGPSSSLRAVQYMNHHHRVSPPEGGGGRGRCADYMRLHGAAGALLPAAAKEGLGEATSSSSSGLERFLHVLRRSFFFYRPMTFRQLTPLSLREGRPPTGGVAPPRTTAATAAATPICPEAVLPALDEAYPLLASPALLASTTSSQPSASASPSAFRLVSVLPLTPHSVLIAFRTSTTTSGESAAHTPALRREEDESGAVVLEDTSGDVFSYAVVNAPPPAFDAAKAKALGVRPGPKYSLLKQGIPVYADGADERKGGKCGAKTKKARAGRSRMKDSSGDSSGGSGGKPSMATDGGEEGKKEIKRQRTESVEENAACEEKAEEREPASPRLIHPREVSRVTEGSRQVFVSLVVDGDSAGDVRAAVESLFLPSEQARSEDDKAGDVLADGEDDSVFERTLLSQAEDLLFYTEHGDRHGELGEVRKKRTVVLRQAVHVQPASFFSHFARRHDIPLSEHEMHHGYTAFLFKRLQTEGAVKLSLHPTLFFSTPPKGGHAGGGGSAAFACAESAITTVHLFTSAVQRHFTAFPTALAHRYHLNTIAPHCFPIDAVQADRGAEGQPLYWPYSYRFRCTPDATDAAAHSSSKKKEAGLEEQLVSEGLTAPFIRYPDAQSAVSMLSQSFLTRLCDTQQQLRQEATSPPPTLLAATATTAHADDGGGALFFTGTGSAVPSKYRNVSGTILEVHAPAQCLGRRAGATRQLARAVFVLDFGEGSLGQLRELFRDRARRDDDEHGGMPKGRPAEGEEGGEEERCHTLADDDLAAVEPALARLLLDIEVVFISHGHADHHLGLLSLLSLRHRCLLAAARARESPRSRSSSSPRRSLTEKLLVVMPAEVFQFMHFSWLTMRPYCDWVYEECEFDILPSSSAASGLQDHHPNPGDGGVWSVNPSPVSLGFPRLKALCQRWNAEAGETAHAKLWDADVFTVDHPANAHAILLRFPFLAPSQQQQQQQRLTSKVFLFSGDTRPSDVLVDHCHAFCRSGPTPSHHHGGQRAEAEKEEGLFICLHEATFGPASRLMRCGRSTQRCQRPSTSPAAHTPPLSC